MTKSIGYLLLTGGFLFGAYSTALDVDQTNWMLFVPAAIAAVVGVIVLKRAESGHATSEEVLSTNRSELTESLDNLVTNLNAIRQAGQEIPVEQLRVEIDARLRDDLRRFADARESMIHLFGLQTYANIMSEFAAGERYVNRVWSASADGYDGEARKYLDKAAAQLDVARRQLAEAAGS